MVRAWGGHKNIVPCSTSSCYAHGCIYFRKRYDVQRVPCQLGERDQDVGPFLETRAALLLKTYKTTSQEDSSMLEKADLSLNCRVAVQLSLAEKQILEKASASGRAKRLHFEKKLEEGAPLPRYEESDIALLENSDANQSFRSFYESWRR
ncbi:hypothetical protein KUCAC02_034773 [Chaenocephalus aceratus]|nr:hypothetical protein KUCAC02_034773 [Chaenocephalus aceratus]